MKALFTLRHHYPILRQLQLMGIGVGVLTFLLMIPISLLVVRMPADIRNQASVSTSGPGTGPSSGPNGNGCAIKPTCLFPNANPQCNMPEPVQGWCGKEDEDIYYDTSIYLHDDAIQCIYTRTDTFVNHMKRGQEYECRFKFAIRNNYKDPNPQPNPLIGLVFKMNANVEAFGLFSYKALTTKDTGVNGDAGTVFTAQPWNYFDLTVDDNNVIAETNEMDNQFLFNSLQGYRKSDFNFDGFVDISDYSILVNNFFQTSIDVDTNEDGFVDLSDYSTFINEFFLPFNDPGISGPPDDIIYGH